MWSTCRCCGNDLNGSDHCPECQCEIGQELCEWPENKPFNERTFEVNEQDAVNQIIEARFAAMKPEKVLNIREEQVLANALFWHSQNAVEHGDEREVALNLLTWFNNLRIDAVKDIVITIADGY